MLMFYECRASPKHRYSIIEVDYGGGGHRTRLREDQLDQLVCLGVPPTSVYKGAKGRGPAGQGGRAKGVLLPLGAGFLPPILVGVGFAEEEREREGGRPPLLVLIGLGEGGGMRPILGCPFSFPLKPIKAHTAPGGFR